MSDIHRIWRKILASEDQDFLPTWVWLKLKEIAQRMDATDFSGDQLSVSKKLFQALGYDDWQDLRESYEMKEDLEFLKTVVEEAKRSHGGIMNPLYEERGDDLKKRVDRTRTRLGIAPFTHVDELSKIQMEKLLDCDGEYGERPLIDQYVSEQTAVIARQRARKAAKKKGNRPKKP